jgi:hypothetical protein
VYVTRREKKYSTKSTSDSSKQSKPLVLRYSLLILSLVILVVYLPTLRLGYTELDDSIFIREQKEYNQALSNLITSFKRGVFHPTEDVYYRPLLLDSFILNYQLSGEEISGWHFINVLLHLGAVFLLFLLLKKLGLPEIATFLLSLFFAVHPVLSQAVAWIPGRNDTLLGIFTFGYLITAINYSDSGKLKWLAAQAALLLCALFTKETAVFAAPAALMILLLIKDRKLFSARQWHMYAAWSLAGLIWLLLRSAATLKHEQLQFAEMVAVLPSRLIVLIHYLGKIVLPVNLSVFPMLEDTSAVFGLVALAVIALLVYLGKEKKRRVIIAGALVYTLFFIPALLVPASLNDQDFEHRTYVPMLGVLLVLSETALFRNTLKESSVLIIGLVICIILSVMNLNHQKNFKDPVTFWKAAVESSPNSAYANMMLGARIDETDRAGSEALIRKSYRIDSAAKYINYYMGVMLQQHDSVIESEPYFLKELQKTDYYMCYFHLARVAFEKQDRAAAIAYLETYLNRVPGDPQANNNLLLLYLETGQPDQARVVADRMKNFGLTVPPEAEKQMQSQKLPADSL